MAEFDRNVIPKGFESFVRTFSGAGETVTFEGEAFSKPPAVFLASSELDAGIDKDLRLEEDVIETTRTGFPYYAGT